MDIGDLSARYCARQDAHAFLVLWGLLLLLAGSAVAAQRFKARFFSRAILLFAFLTVALSASIFYGCSMTAASEQGLGSDLPAGTYTFLRCLGWDALSTVLGWTILVVSCIVALGLVVVGIRHRRKAVRIVAPIGAALLSIVTLLMGLGLLFGFSWCTSERLF